MACDLPLDFANPLLPWLPDETLYSLASRHHRLWGHRLSSQSAKLLFGAPHAGTHHDFPNALSEFAERTSGALGQAKDIAEQRTLLRFYRAFSSDSEARSAAATMASPSVAHLKLRLGLLTSRFRAHHPLKACCQCIHRDVLTQGWAYWHLEHQYPGVWVCDEHDTPLQESAFKSSGVERFLWHLPSLEKLRPQALSSSSQEHTAAISLSAMIVKLVRREQSDGWLQTSSLLPTFRRRLENLGMITAGGSLRLHAAAEAFLAHCQPLRQLSELSALPKSLDEATAQIGRILRPLRTGTHPLRTLLVIHWLFGTDTDFVLQHLGNAEIDGKARPEAVPSPGPAGVPAHPDKGRAVALMAAGESARSAARTVGVDIGTALAWASQAGVEVARRPKTLDEAIRSRMAASLRNGTDKRQVATDLGLSVTTVTRVLLGEPGLREEWFSARFDARRAEARRVWADLTITHKGAGTKIVRALEPATYAWLYRNDRAWLGAHPVTSAGSSGSRTPRVRWDSRDAALSAAVERTVLDLRTRGQRLLRLWQLYQAIPELKAKLAVLDRLPLTKRAIEQALRPNPLNGTLNL